MSSLETRVCKIEAMAGRGRAPTENQWLAARALISRHFEAVVLPELFGQTGNGNAVEFAAMWAAEDSGQLEAAYEVERRYWRARGVDHDQRMREISAEIRAVMSDTGQPKKAAGDDGLH